jgi:hypothetical protein
MQQSIEELLQTHPYKTVHTNEMFNDYCFYLKTLAKNTIMNMCLMDRVNYIGTGRGSEQLYSIEHAIIHDTRGQNRVDLLTYIYTELHNTIQESDMNETCKVF